jgi:hypothetical protein
LVDVLHRVLVVDAECGSQHPCELAFRRRPSEECV